MTINIAIAQLRNCLVKLYPSPEQARRLVDDAGINSGNINFQGSTAAFWHAILTEANNRNLIAKLLECARQEYDTNEELHAVCASYFKIANDPEVGQKTSTALAEIAEEEAPPAWLTDVPCPYRGLEIFTLEHAENYFGRDEMVNRLVEKLKQVNLVALVGPSGSGKSSVIRAGLLSELQKDALPNSSSWNIEIFRPSDDPLRELMVRIVNYVEPNLSHLTRLAEAKRQAALLLNGELPIQDILANILEDFPHFPRLFIVDQFEEIYTLCNNADIRQSFLETMFDAAQTPWLKIIFALRADFYGFVLQDSQLGNYVDKGLVNVLPMTSAEYQAVIEEPARNAGRRFQNGLIERILEDVHEQPGSLPLLEFALTELWERQTRDGELTHEAYNEIGQVEGAIAKRANETYRTLDPQAQQNLRRIFTRLVRLAGTDEGVEDTRRRVTLTEISNEMQPLIRQLADARLLVTDHDQGSGTDTVEVAHEALIRNWDRFREWLDTDREFLLWRQRLRHLVGIWQNSGLQEDALLRGELLIEAHKWGDSRTDELSEAELNFIHISQQREAEEERTARRRQRIAIGSVLAMALIITISLFIANNYLTDINANLAEALQKTELERQRSEEESNRAEEERQRAEAERLLTEIERQRADEEALNAKRQALLSSAGQLAAQSQLAGTILTERRQGLPLILASEAVMTTWRANTELVRQPFVTIQADRALQLAVDNAAPWRMTLPPIHHRQGILAMAIDPLGKLLAVADDNHTIHLWELETGRHLRELWHSDNTVRTLLFLHDGKHLFFGSGDSIARLVDVTTGEVVQRFVGHTEGVWSVAKSSDEAILATASEDGTVRFWEQSSGEIIRVFNNIENAAIRSVAIHPNGQRMAASGDSQITVWDLGSGNVIASLSHSERVQVIQYSPDGRWLLSGTRQQTGGGAEVCLWETVAYTQIICHEAHNDTLTMVSANKNGTLYVTSSEDATAKMWDSASHELLYTIEGHQGDVNSAVFSPDNEHLITGGADRTIRIWDTVNGTFWAGVGSHVSPVLKAIESPDGRVVASAGVDGLVNLWDPQSGMLQKSWLAHRGAINELVFSSNGAMLATAGDDGQILLWDVVHAEVLLQIGAHIEAVTSIAIAPDDTMLVSGSTDRSARLWDLATGNEIRLIGEHGAEVSAVAFSPDGTQIMTAGEDRVAYLWDVKSGDELYRFSGHVDAVKAAALSPDGTKIATLDKADTIRIWQIGVERPLNIIEAPAIGINSISFGPDSKSILYTTGASGDAAINDPQIAELVTLSGDLLMRLEGHMGPVRSARFSRDGNRIITTSTDRTVRIWDSKTAGQNRRLVGHTDDVKDIAIHPKEPNLVVAVGDDHAVRIWDVQNGNQEAMFDGGHTDEVFVALFNKDGTQLASGSDDNTIRIWDIVNGNQVFRLEGHTERVLTVAFHPNGEILASGGGDNSVLIWDLKTGTMLDQITDHSDNVNSIAYHPNGEIFAVGGEGGLLYLWDVAQHTRLRTLDGHIDGIEDLRFSPDGNLLVSGGEDGTVRIWSTSDGEELSLLEGHSGTVYSVVFSADGQQILSGSDDGSAIIWDLSSSSIVTTFVHEIALYAAAFNSTGTIVATAGDDGNCYLWDVATGEIIRKLVGHDDALNWVDFHPNQNLLVTASNDNSIRLWNTDNGEFETLIVGHMDSINAVAVSPDGQLILTGSDDKSAILWDINMGAPKYRLSGHENDVNTVAFSHDGQIMATGSDDQTVRIWDVASGDLIYLLEGYNDDVNALAFSPTEPILATADKEGLLWLWDTTTGKLLRQLDEVQALFNEQSTYNSLAFSPDGQHFVTGDDGQYVILWETSTLEPVLSMRQHEDDVNAVDFSSDGSLLVSAGADNTVRIWDARTGQQLRLLEGHENEINAVSFNGDGTKVASGGDDFVLLIWDSTIEPLLTRAQSLIQRDNLTLTTDERLRFLQGE